MIALYELQCKVAVIQTIRILAEKSLDSCCSQIASLATSDATMYSTFLLERFIHSWSFDLHEIAPPAKVNT